jgi:hypothetical protein
MNKKQRLTLQMIFEKPVRSDILWKDIEGLFIALGAEIRAVFHRPHPERITNKGTIKSVRRFLIESGVQS